VLGKVGIPAGSDGLAFLFSGPRLFPVVGAHELGFSIVSVLLVTTVSCVYPAWLAMRVSPREAMRTGD
jgi:ABC-type antimicrobial peptide transport system permease subunit